MIEIVTDSRGGADKRLRRNHQGFRSVISISSVDTDPGATRPPFFVRQFPGMKLVLYFDDNVDGPQESDVRKIVSFAKRVSHKGAWPMLVHCTAGIARSASAMLICHAALAKDPLQVAVEDLLDPKWHWPNKRMLELCDEQIGSDLEYRALEWEKKNWRDDVCGAGGWEDHQVEAEKRLNPHKEE